MMRFATTIHEPKRSAQDARAELPSAKSGPALAGAIWLVVGISIVFHVLVISSSTGARDDIQAYAIQAATVGRHQNVYLATPHYPYPPVWIWIVAGCNVVGTAFSMPLANAVKLLLLGADVAITVLLYLASRSRFGARWFSLVPAALYALNPVVIQISAGHGQFDALVIACIVLAIVLRGPSGDQRSVGSAVALGLAIALKGFPILLVPYFAWATPPGKRARFLIWTLLPLGVAMVLYSALFSFSMNMLTHVIQYRSTVSLGWLWVIGVANVWRFVSSGALGTVVFVVIYALSQVGIVVFAAAVPALRLRDRPFAAVAAVFCALYATTPTMSVQYLLWAVPFLAMELPLGAVVYSACAEIAAIGFYAQDPAGSGALAWQPTANRIWAALATVRLPATVGITVISAAITLVLLFPAVRMPLRARHLTAMLRAARPTSAVRADAGADAGA